jgi:hypothetical protein
MNRPILLALWIGLALFLSGPARASRPGGTVVFIENRGQFAPEVLYMARDVSGAWWITADGLWLSQPDGQNSLNIELKYEGQHDAAVWQGQGRLPMRVSYYRGQAPSGWAENVPVWSELRLSNLHPGLDLVLSSEGNHVTWHLEGAAPWSSADFRFTIDAGGAKAPDVQGPGRMPLSLLRVSNSVSEPAAQQTAALVFGTYMGGSAADYGASIVEDSSGRILISGHGESLDFPGQTGRRAAKHNIEGFVARFDPGGTQLDYLVLFIGDIEDFIKDIAVDSAGNVYGAGSSDSTDFPATVGAYDTTPNGGFDAVAVKIDADGTLEWATYLGHDDTDEAQAIILDGNANPYLLGGTWSADFPTSLDALDDEHNGARDVFLAQLNSAGASLSYSTFVGGSGQEQGEGLDYFAGALYATGWTNSSDFPTKSGSYDTSFGGSFDAFIFKLTPGSSTMDFSTFAGEAGEDRGWSLVVDGSGQAHVGGSTTSDPFPTTGGAIDSTYAGGLCDFLACPDGFLLRLNAAGSALGFSTYLGGGSWDVVNDVALGAAGTLYAIGFTQSADFPVSLDAYDSSLSGDSDAFVAMINSSATVLNFGSYLGGSLDEEGNGVAVNVCGLIYVTGGTISLDFPTIPGAYDLSLNGDFDSFTAALNPTGDAVPAGCELFIPVVQR